VYLGKDERDTLRQKRSVTRKELTEIRRKLDRYDSASKRREWTIKILQLLDAYPGLRAAELAGHIDAPVDWFKRNVSKLKELGLTESLKQG